MNAEEKIETLTDYYLHLDAEMQAQSLPHLLLVLKAMILHVAIRSEVSVGGLLEGLAESYVQNVEAHRGKSQEEIHSLLLDELARQEELT